MPKYAQYWTKSAIECYKRNCSCSGCTIQSIMGQRCAMKKTVLVLLRKFGKPKEVLIPGTTELEDRVVRAILKGYDTFEIIAQKTNINKYTVARMCQNLYMIAETRGCKFKRDNNRLPELIEFIKKENAKKGGGMQDRFKLKCFNKFQNKVFDVKSISYVDGVIKRVEVQDGERILIFDEWMKNIDNTTLIQCTSLKDKNGNIIKKSNLKDGLIKLIEEENIIKEFNEIVKNYYITLETKDYIKYLASFVNDKEEAENYFFEVL